MFSKVTHSFVPDCTHILTYSPLCLQHQLSNMLTLHVRSRAFPQLEDAAQFIKAIIGMYDVFMENKRIKAAQAVANLVEVDSTAAAAAVAAETAAMEADVQVSLVACHTALPCCCCHC